LHANLLYFVSFLANDGSISGTLSVSIRLDCGVELKGGGCFFMSRTLLSFRAPLVIGRIGGETSVSYGWLHAVSVFS